MSGRSERKRITRRIEAEKRVVESIQLTRDQAHAIGAIVTGFQSYLESAIEALIVPGTNRGMNAEDDALLNALRKQWRKAEDIHVALESRGKVGRVRK